MLEEKDLEVARGVMGCGYLFSLNMMESLSFGGFKNGMKKSKIRKLSALMVAQAAETVLSSKNGIGDLQDEFVSPGDPVLEAVKSIEEDGFRSAVINAVDVVVEKECDYELEN